MTNSLLMQNMCFINNQYVNNRHANKKLVNSEKRSVLLNVFLLVKTKMSLN